MLPFEIGPKLYYGPLSCRTKVFEPIEEMLRTGNEGIQKQILDTLKIKRLGSAAPPSVVMQVGQLANCKDVSIARRAVLALGYMSPDLMLPTLADTMQTHSRLALRKNAVTVSRNLAWSKDPRALDPLIVALNDTNKDVRRTAVLALNRLSDTRAVEPLIVALNDTDSYVRKHAAWALRGLGDSRAVDPLIVTLNDPDKDVRHTAADALGKLGDTRAVKPLITTLLNDPDWYVRTQAADALGELGGATVVKSLIAALNDPDRRVQRSAAKALGESGGLRAVKPLVAAALNDPDKDMRHTAADALERLWERFLLLFNTK